MSKTLHIFLPFLYAITPVYLAADTQDSSNQLSQNNAFDKGCLLYAQYKFTKAEEWLAHAIDQGVQDASYLSAKIILLKTKANDLPQQSKKYFLKAANQGHLESMKFLYEEGEWLAEAERLQWKQHYYNELIHLGAQDPAKAYFRLSEYHNNNNKMLADYELQQALKFDFPAAWLVYASQRPIKEAKKIYLSEAEKGVIPAIRHVITLLEQEAQFDKALHWREVNAQHGDLPSVASLGLIYQGKSVRYSFVEQDLAKAYAYYITYLENTGTARFSHLRNTIDENLKTLTNTLSKERLSYANTLVQSWSTTQYYYHDALWEQANCRIE